MKGKPDWVADWIWLEYQELFRRGALSGRSQRIIFDLDCACVWQAMDARRGEATRRHVERCKSLLGGLPNFQFPSETDWIFSEIDALSEGIPVHESMPAAVRRAKGRKISQLARKLHDELTELWVAEVGFPVEFERELEKLWRKRADLIVEHYGKQQLEMGAIPEIPSIEACAPWIEAVSMDVTLDISEALSTIETAAKDFSQSKPPVTQLTNDGAERLYFIRGMTRFFRKSYGTPLREQVAALVGVMFDCEMNAATVAKLAH